MRESSVNSDDLTIVVVPRDHFSDSRESLESIVQFTRPMCPLVYVDGGSPPRDCAATFASGRAPIISS